MVTALRSRTARTLAAILTMALFAIAVARCFQNFPAVYDIALWDETTYMATGLNPAIPLPGSYEWAGLYSLLYRGLGHLIADPIDVHLGGGLVFILTTLALLFLALLILSRSPAVATAGAALFMISGAALVLPRVTLAATALLAVWLCFAHRRPPVVQLAAAALTAFLMSFIRPEYALSFLLLTAAALAALAWQGVRALRGKSGSAARGVPTAILLLCAVAGLCVIWSIPWPQGGGRAFFAFAQHYAYRAVTTQGLAIDPWIEWKAFTDTAFPGATSVAAAAMVNPAAFAGFVLANLADGVRGMGGWLLDFWTSAWGDGAPLRLAALALFTTATAAALALGVAARDRPAWRNDITTAVILLAFAAPVVLATVLIYPRAHYLIQLLFMALALVALLAAGDGRGRGVWLGPLAGAAALVLTPVLPAVPQPAVDIIQALRLFPPMQAMAELDGMWCAYLRPPCRFVILDQWPAGMPFETFLDSRGADAVMVSPRLRAIPRFAGDPWLQRTLAEPDWATFEPHPLPHGYTLLRRRTPTSR